MEIPLFDFTKSANVNVSPFLQPAQSPTILNGFTNARKIGALVQDVGSSLVDAQIQANKSVLSLYNFIQTTGTEKMLATIDDSTSDDTQLFYRANGAGSWTEITDAETAWANVAGAKVEMATFIGYCFFVGYSSVDGFLPVASVTNTTFSTVTNVTSMPQAKYIVPYRDRLYLLNVRYGAVNYPFRMVASSVPVAGAISWSTAGSPTSSTGGFLDVNYSYDITGGAENWDVLMVFTDFSAYRYDQSSWKKVWDTGCSNHRSIKTQDAYMIWASARGVHVSTGGQPQNIAGEIIDFILGSDSRNYFAEIVDDIYYLYIGNVTVDGIAYANTVLKFNINLSTWEWRELPSPITSFAKFKDGGSYRLYMGDTSGYVWNKAKHTDSTLISIDQSGLGSGLQIACNFELPPIILDGGSKIKKIRKIIAYADRAQGLTLYARTIDRNTRVQTEYLPLGKLTKYINPFDVNVKPGSILQIAGSIAGKLPYCSFYGLILDVDVDSAPLKKTYK